MNALKNSFGNQKPKKLKSFRSELQFNILQKKIETKRNPKPNCINIKTKMSAEQMNEIALMSAEDRNVAVANEPQCYGCGDMPCVEPEDPMDTRFCESCFQENKRIDEELDKHNEEMDKRHNPLPQPKKVRKPKIECCACNEYFKDSEICRSAYDEAFCYDCYDDEYKKCIMCDTECSLDKEDDEWYDRDGDCYCEDCCCEYDADEKKDKEDQRRKWVEDYNKSLTNYYIGGIYDSEYMNYVYDNIETPKIKEIKKIQRGECFRG